MRSPGESHTHLENCVLNWRITRSPGESCAHLENHAPAWRIMRSPGESCAHLENHVLTCRVTPSPGESCATCSWGTRGCTSHSATSRCPGPPASCCRRLSDTPERMQKTTINDFKHEINFHTQPAVFSPVLQWLFLYAASCHTQ